MFAIALLLPALVQSVAGASLPLWDWNADVLPVRTTDPPLAKWHAKTSLFVYFEPDCSHCQDNWPHVVAMAKRARANGLKVGGIASYATSRADIVMFLEALGEDVPVWFDSSRAVAASYGIKTVPKAILVKPSGEVQLFGDLTSKRWTQIEAIAKREVRKNP